MNYSCVFFVDPRQVTWHITKAKWQWSKYLAELKLAVCLTFNPNTAALMDYVKTALS